MPRLDLERPVTDLELSDEEPIAPVAGARIIYMGPVAPHWEVERTYGDEGHSANS